MADLVYLTHPDTGASVRVPQRMVAGAERNGFVLKEARPIEHHNKPESDSDDGLESLTKEQLQERLAAQDLPTSGNKDDLIARLRERNQLGF